MSYFTFSLLTVVGPRKRSSSLSESSLGNAQATEVVSKSQDPIALSAANHGDREETSKIPRCEALFGFWTPRGQTLRPQSSEAVVVMLVFLVTGSKMMHHENTF